MGLVIAVLGIRVVAAIFRERHEIFDDDITPHDRAQISQAAFFIILPITVALHELGHAVLIKLFGAEITDWGFYFFSGFVGYQGIVTDTQQILIAAAGVTVNLILGAIALAVVFLRRPPMRPAVNELLVTATIISVANALIFYPILDLATDLNGDFRQMYFGNVPWLSATIFAVHASVLIGAYAASKSERISARLAGLTGLPPHVRRGMLGGLRFATPQGTGPSSAGNLTPTESTMRTAGTRVASGWQTPIQGMLLRRPEGPALILRWSESEEARSVAVATEVAGSVIVTLPRSSDDPNLALRYGDVWRRWSEMPDEDDLTLTLRLAMEEVERRANLLTTAVEVRP
jgi:hypothetical protein